MNVPTLMPIPFEAVNFGDGGWRAVANGQLQSPDFNCKGAAEIFARAVYEGRRKAEPAIKETNHV